LVLKAGLTTFTASDIDGRALAGAERALAARFPSAG
jgi:hypothetical protein